MHRDYGPVLPEWFRLRKEAVLLKERELEEKKSLGLYDSDSISFLLEFGTLNLDFGRQTGKSYFIVNFMMNEFEGKCIVLTPNERVSDCLRRNVWPRNECSKGDRIYTIKDFLKSDMLSSLSGVSKQIYIVIDSSSLISKTQLESIYKTASSLNTEMVVLC